MLKNNLITVLFISLVFIQGCIEKSVKTKINSDGTCERIITGDSSFIFHKLPFNIALDKSWKIISKKDTIIASKTFSSFDALEEEFKPSTQINKLDVSVKIKKQFRWFFTHYIYNETYKLNNKWKKIPENKFFTPGELNIIQSDSLGKSLENKIEEYWMRNVFEEIYSVIENEAEVSGYNITKRDAVEKKETLYKNLQSDSIFKGGDDGELINEKRIIANIELTFGIKTDERLRKSIKGLTSKLDKEFTSILEMGSIDLNEISLPGIIINTNSKEVIGNKLSWKIDVTNLLITSKQMHAESRIINTWAFVVTGIAVILIIAALVIPLWKRRKFNQ